MTTATFKSDLDKPGVYAEDTHRNQDKTGIEPLLENADQAFMKATDIENFADELKRHHLQSIESGLQDVILKDDLMYKKLISRITTFFAKIENDRRKSRTDSAIKNRSGAPLSQQIQLYTCLRQMMLHIVGLTDINTKKTQLRQVYEWFLTKLVSIGALNRQEIEAEIKFLHPMTNQLTIAFKNALGRKLQQLLANDEYMTKAWKQMFLKDSDTDAPPERTWITEMDPSFQRIKEYKTKTCKNGPADEIAKLKMQEAQLTQQRL